MVCKVCGKENKGDARYCSDCGAELKKRSKKAVLVTIFVIGIIILADVILKTVVPNLDENSDNKPESTYTADENSSTVTDSKTNEYTYELNEVFEIGGIYLKLTKAFAGSEYEFWKSTDDDTWLAGFEGKVRNTSSHDVNLADLSYYLCFIDGNGKDQYTDEPRVECYAPATTGDIFSTSNIIGAGQEGDIYIFLSPDKYCETLYVTISDSDTSKKITVRNPYYCNGSYENEEKTSFVRMAKGYSEDLACIQFYMNEREYYGYMDKEANIKFYFPSKYDGEFCNPPTNFKNGYAYYKYGDNVYVFDKEGNVTSQYDKNSLITYGNGYTWMKTDLSGFDGTGYKYTLYAPDGEVETELKSVEEETDFWKTSTNVTIKHLGTGIFLCQYQNENDEIFREYYFTQSHKWVTPELFNDIEDTLVLNGYLYNCVYYTNEEQKKYLDLYDEAGEKCEITVPDELFDASIRVCDITDQYILLESRYEDEDDNSQTEFWVYDKANEDFKCYDGRYIRSINDAGHANKLFEDSIVISMIGQDEKTYIGFISITDMTELGEPIQADRVKVYKDVVVVRPGDSSEAKQILYDSNGNILYTYTPEEYTGWLNGFEDNTMVTGCGEEYSTSKIVHKYMDYSGNPLVESINYASGFKVDLSAEKPEQ